MDKLLQKLRQNMAELSLQGDDFTRQIWHMYATFEEFIDHQQTSGEGSPASSRTSPTGPSGNEAPPPPAPPGGLGAPGPRDVVTGLGPVSRLAATSVVASASSREAAAAAAAAVSTRAHMAQVGIHAGGPPPMPHGDHSPLLTARDDLALASPRRRRRPHRLRRSVDNPLLDTISAIGGDPDSDEGDLLPPAPPPSASSSSSCWGPRLHPEADVVGYAGSNSVDSGYKSACPTPELPDAAAYLEPRLEKRGSLASLASTGSSSGSGGAPKPRIAMGTRVMSRVPRSPSSGGGAPSPGLPRRPGSDGSYYDLDQLAGIRSGILGSPPPAHAAPAEVRNPGFTRYSPRGSPAPQRNASPSGGATPRDAHVSRRAASPASPERRPRSASTGSRCSPGTRGRRAPGGLRAGSPLLASTGSLPRAASPGRRPRAPSPAAAAAAAREESRPPTSWSRHSSPGVAPPARSLRRPPSPIVGVHDDTDLALLEREIDALLYGGRAGRCDPLAPHPPPDYYDLDSEFAACTCPAFVRTPQTGTTLDLTVCCSASDGVVGSSGGAPCPPGCAPRLLPCSPPAPCSPAVARCVLAVLDDFQCRSSSSAPLAMRAARSLSSDGRDLLSAGGAPVASSSSSRDIFQDLRRQHQQQQHLLLHRRLQHLDDSASESSYDSASEYHLYEEILYEATTAPKPPQSVPPPLPARPPHLFRGGQQHVDAAQPPKQDQQQTPRPQQPLPPPPGSSSSSQRQPPEVQTQQKAPGPQQTPDAQQQSPQQSPGASKPAPPPKPPKPGRPPGSSSGGKPVPPPKPSSAALPSPSITVTPPASSAQQGSGSTSPSSPQQAEQGPQEQRQGQQKEGAAPLKAPTNKPKQRSNLYSIFRDRDHRRCLSASLQQEYHQQDYHTDPPSPHPASAPATCASLAAADDDYGFKVVPHVV